MKFWHRFLAWNLSRKVRREHHQLSKYVRRSAYEIAAWQQDISFLEQKMERHLSLSGILPPEPVSATENHKVVPLEKVSFDLLPRMSAESGRH